jgi:hypothetical protein
VVSLPEVNWLLDCHRTKESYYSLNLREASRPVESPQGELLQVGNCHNSRSWESSHSSNLLGE